MGWLIFFGVILFIFLMYKAVEWENNKKKARGELLNNKFAEIENFTASKQINSFDGFYIFAIDESNEKIAYVTELDKTIIEFANIIGVELIEDGNTVSKKSTSRTIGGALVGGALTGGVGAIIGGLSGSSTQKNKVSSLSVKIHLRSLDKPSLLIKCFDSRTMTTEHKASIETDGNIESWKYKFGKQNADEIKDLISVIIDRIDSKTVPVQETTITTKPTNSLADELLKLNELKEKGILTEEEFNNQKNKILNT